MNKKFLSVILFSALMVGTAGTFTSCKDYDDDIDQINNELTGIKASISDLQAKVGDGKFVTNVVKNGDGITITWSDNTTSTIGTIKGDKGDKGDAATITIDPVTKNFIINNEDTGICSEGKNGVNGINAKAPSISKETGNWVTYEWDAEKNDYVGTDTGISAMGASTYVVDKTSYWELHVATSENGEGEPAVIKLPKAASITSLKAVSIDDGQIKAANVTMSYGKALGADVKFNNVTYKKDAILLSQTSTLSAIVNPQDADATKYAYVLSDSKGNMPFKVTNPVANMTEDALTRAASVNKGVFDMTVEYLSTANCGKSAGTYALTTETADGLVASAYDVKVTEKAVNTIAVTNLKALSVDINKELDLIGCFKNANVATVNGVAVADLTPYIVDYYFEIADKTAAANLGATISGNTIKAEKAGLLDIKVNLKPYNPVAMINEEYDVEGYNQLMMSGKITLSPIEGLNLSVMGAMQRFDRMENKSNTFKHMTTVVNGDYGNVWNWADNTMQKNLELVGDYTKSLGLHNLGAMIGYSYQDDDAKGIYQWAKDFPTDMFGPWNIGSMNDMKDNKAAMTSYRNTHKLISFFGRLTYNYNEKYMFMASLRREGSSRFGDNHKWGWFPAISAGWRISKENFMQDIQWLDDLKVRIGYGVTGNEVTSNLLSMYLLNYGGYAYINGKWTQGAGPYQNPNPDLKWETKSELNLGLDFSFLKNRLSGSIDIYHRETSDLLSTYEVPTPPYIVSSMMANVGKIRNQGIELLLSGTPIKTRDLRFDITGTFSYNKNKIISLSNGLYQKDYWYEGATGSPIQTHTHIVREGDPVGNFHGFQTHSLTSDGLWMVYGTDGQPKLLTDADDGDKKVIGNGIPTTYGSLNLALSYKGFDVSVMFRGAFNFQVLNRQRMHWETTSRIGEGNLPRSVLEKPFGSNSYVKGAPAMQSYYVEDGDYVKLDNINVGYTFNLKKQKVIQRLRLYVAGNNLLTMTGYKGLDPEVSIKGLAPGVEGSGAGELYPTTRQFTVGLNLLF